MNGHTIYVNGEKVNADVVSNGDSINITFSISDLNDSIKVGLYVIPMGRNIEFGLKLNGISDDVPTVPGQGTGTTGTETLPQTGAAIDANMIMGAGAIMMSAGILGRRKRK